MKTSDAGKLSSCFGMCRRCGRREGGFFVVGLAGGQAVVEAPEEPTEEVALGGGVAVAVGLAPVWVPRTSSTSRDQAVFVDRAADESLSSDAVVLKIGRFGQRFQRRSAVQGAVRPVPIVVGLVIAQDLP
jgi:hypothetical protein